MNSLMEDLIQKLNINELYQLTIISDWRHWTNRTYKFNII